MLFLLTLFGWFDARYCSFFLAGFSTVKENFVGTDPGLSWILFPPSGFIKQSLSKCLLQT